MAHRNFRGRASQTNRRKRLWADLNVQSAGGDLAVMTLTPPDLVAAGSSLAVSGFPSSGAPALLEATVMRIRGYIDVPKTAVGTSGLNDDVFAFGIGLVSEEAFEVAAVPNPATGSGLDWDGWMFLRSSSQAALDPASTIMDVKAMRKWESGQALVFVAGMATTTVSGLIGQQIVFSARGLFLLA